MALKEGGEERKRGVGRRRVAHRFSPNTATHPLGHSSLLTDKDGDVALGVRGGDCVDDDLRDVGRDGLAGWGGVWADCRRAPGAGAARAAAAPALRRRWAWGAPRRQCAATFTPVASTHVQGGRGRRRARGGARLEPRARRGIRADGRRRARADAHRVDGMRGDAARRRRSPVEHGVGRAGRRGAVQGCAGRRDAGPQPASRSRPSRRAGRLTFSGGSTAVSRVVARGRE